MYKKVGLKSVYTISEDIVAREIEGELIIIPITSGIADMEEELFTLNETGKSIWNKLDGKKNLEIIINELSQEYAGSLDEIKKDAVGIVKELLKRKMLVERK